MFRIAFFFLVAVKLATALPEEGMLAVPGDAARSLDSQAAELITDLQQSWVASVPEWTGGLQLVNADMLNACDDVVWTTGMGVRLGEDTANPECKGNA